MASRAFISCCGAKAGATITNRIYKEEGLNLRSKRPRRNKTAAHRQQRPREFISKTLDKWAYDNQVTLDFSRPGKPTDNPFIESFNGSFRDECLNVNWFLSLEDAKEKIQLFKEEYNGFRPHSSWSGLTPNELVHQHSNGPNFFILGG